MPSRMAPSLRRPRSDIEDDEVDDDLNEGFGSQNSSPSASGSAKRARYHSDSESESPNPEDPHANLGRQWQSNTNGGEDVDEPVDGNHAGGHLFQPGAIVRVKLTNFVTYENAEFYPGPNLNMVIGPNGTGKSSLVCAICLGLGWGPQHLGRAAQVGEFVKHGMNDAQVEIELQRRTNESQNHVVRVRIIRDGNGREWWLNGRKTSLKAVQALTRNLSIQIDNLCQFLPQDKVSEFAALSPVELLQQTQRAAAPEQMLEWHEQLKRDRKDQKSLELQHRTDKEHLENLENRQQNLRAEVQRLEERNQIQEKISLLQKSVPFVEYRIARTKHMEFKQKKLDAQHRLRQLEAQVQPTLQSVNLKQRYKETITAVVKERKKAVETAERAADGFIQKIEALDDNVQQNEQQGEAERRGDSKRRQELQTIQRKISEWKVQLREEPIEFNSADWNERIRAKEHEIRAIDTELRDLQVKNKDLRDRGMANREAQERVKEELAAFNSQEGQQMNKIYSASKETATAWKWIQENQNEFEKEVYGPPMISCSVKDPKYTDAIESLLQRTDFLAITAQTKADWLKLNEQIYGTMKLADVTLRSSTDALADYQRPMSIHEMRRCGFDGWALDFIDGPEPVLAMLCVPAKLNSTGISIEDISEDQYKSIVQGGEVNSWIVGKHNYKVTRRREYGPGASSTVTKNVNSAKVWIDGPIDASGKRDIEMRLADLLQKFQQLKEQIEPIRQEIKNLQADRSNMLEEVAKLKEDKGNIQKAHGVQKALPDKIQREEEILAEKQRKGIDIRERLNTLEIQHDHFILRKAAFALQHKDMVGQIRICHDELLEAEIRLIEAASDVEGLVELNSGIVQRLEEERQLVKDIERESKIVKDKAAKALAVCQEIRAEAEADGNIEHFQTISNDLTVESLEMEIIAEQAKLEFVHAGNPNAIRDFERRQVDVDKLREKIGEVEKKLDRIGSQITKVRARWEPELDKLIGEISDAFSYNFEQIGCAGEVSVHKDDDFDLWAVQIKVKFREKETLQLLDQHRQSGGERSVSTIFYLMSLQSLARAPFRVVDEINQGMDPRNERMVHERMVEIACKEHVSQYFLITPKLLTGLRYDKRMKVLCIASGEYMPEDYKTLDVSKIIGIREAIMASG